MKHVVERYSCFVLVKSCDVILYVSNNCCITTQTDGRPSVILEMVINLKKK